MTTYTNITKPSGTSYTNTNPVGKQQYDESSLTYDDSGTYYDGYNPVLYTNIAKPTFQFLTIPSGTATGLLTPPTYAEAIQVEVDPYTYISKPS